MADGPGGGLVGCRALLLSFSEVIWGCGERGKETRRRPDRDGASKKPSDKPCPLKSGGQDWIRDEDGLAYLVKEDLPGLPGLPGLAGHYFAPPSEHQRPCLVLLGRFRDLEMMDLAAIYPDTVSSAPRGPQL